MATVQALLHEARDLPGGSARRDAEILLCHCLGQPRTYLFTWPEAPVPAAAAARYRDLLDRRRQGHPVAYLTGERGFWSLSLGVDEHTLIPRPETELLVEWALALPLPDDAAVLDLGTGSGAIALALASERPSWAVTAVDASPGAVARAQSNASALGLGNVSLVQSDWYAGVAGTRFALIVSNPPYVAAGDPHLSQGDLRFEPATALVAGEDGLADLRRIIAGAPDSLTGGGFLLVEHGMAQGAAVRQLLEAAGFARVETRQDLAGLDRVSGGCWHAD
jgi:release factor glutamine methyltransferase